MKFCPQPYKDYLKTGGVFVSAIYPDTRKSRLPEIRAALIALVIAQSGIVFSVYPVIQIKQHTSFIEKLALFTTDLDTARYHRSA
jgi:hypothetical protein